ncbi:MAG: Oligosaccharyltransferase subunit Ribophorin II-domain-containing protein [Benniella sp.]|nr:MAG: Oligosaccharyltransferase subunit Ribophorin II-domain-containing protein [Benniella sp.]
MAKIRSLWLVALLASVSSVLAEPWKVSGITVQLLSGNGVKKTEQTLEHPHEVSGLSAEPTDTFKFLYKIENSERPHQAMILFQSQDEYKDEVMVATSIKSSGKGRLELNFARADPKFRYGTRSYSMTLLIGGPKVKEPLRYTFGQIEVKGPIINPAKRPKRIEYKAQPEIHHQFRPDQKLIDQSISGAFTILVLTPFLVLFTLWSLLGIRFEPLRAMLSRPLDLITSLVFFGSLAGIEYVFYLYWTHVTLFPVLQYLGALSVVAFFSGRSALSAVQVRRLQRTATPAKKDS